MNAKMTTHVHDEVPAAMESVLGQGFCQEIGVLAFRPSVRDVKLSIFVRLSQEVMTHIDVLRVRVGHKVNRHLDLALVVLKNLDARIHNIK